MLTTVRFVIPHNAKRIDVYYKGDVKIQKVAKVDIIDDNDVILLSFGGNLKKKGGDKHVK